VGLLIVFVKARDFDGAEDWMSEDTVPPEALRHFNDPELSIFRAPSRYAIPRLVAAFALSHPQRLSSKDFVALEESRLDMSALTVVATAGYVPDKIVRDWHYDVLAPDAAAVRRMAYAFGKYGTCHRVTLAQVKDVVRMSHDLD
jgi:hypothetical protein